jgi:hypothetical protein
METTADLRHHMLTVSVNAVAFNCPGRAEMCGSNADCSRSTGILPEPDGFPGYEALVAAVV